MIVVRTNGLIANATTAASPSTDDYSVATDVLNQDLSTIATMAIMTRSDDNAFAALEGAVSKGCFATTTTAVSCYSTGTSWWAEIAFSDGGQQLFVTVVDEECC